MFIIEFFHQAGREFLSLLVLVLPYFLIGALAGALLETYLKPEMATKYLGRGFAGTVKASLLGAILPGCACATMPMAKGLKSSGATLGTVGAFILVSPLLSPHTLILNYGMLGMEFTIARIVVSLVGAIILGMVFNFLEKRHVKGFFAPAEALPLAMEQNSCLTGHCSCSSDSKKSFWKNVWGIIRGLSKYFVLGMAIASILTTLIPENAVPEYIGSSGVFAYATAVLVGIPLYVCEGEEIPITLSLLRLGLGTGPSFAFLLGSVGTCIPTFIMAQKIIGKRPTLLYIIGWFVFAIVSGFLFQLVFPIWG